MQEDVLCPAMMIIRRLLKIESTLIRQYKGMQIGGIGTDILLIPLQLNE